MSGTSQEPTPVAVIPPSIPGANSHAENPVKMQRPFMDGDFEFVSCILHSSFQFIARLMKIEIERRKKRGARKPCLFLFLFFFCSSSGSKEIASWAIWTITLLSFSTPDTSSAAPLPDIPGSPFCFVLFLVCFMPVVAGFEVLVRDIGDGYEEKWYPFFRLGDFLGLQDEQYLTKCRNLVLALPSRIWRVWKMIPILLCPRVEDRLKTSSPDLYIIT